MKGRWLLALLALLLVACTGEGGSATGQTQNCRTSQMAGSCQGSYRSVRGHYTFRTGEVYVPRDTPVRVRAEVEVEEGALRVRLVGPDDGVTESVARPGQPAVVDGLALRDGFETVPVGLHVVEGEEARGVRYQIAWEVE